MSYHFCLPYTLIWWLPQMKVGLLCSCSQLLTIRWKSASISSWLSHDRSVVHSSAAQVSKKTCYLQIHRFLLRCCYNKWKIPLKTMFLPSVLCFSKFSMFYENAPDILDSTFKHKVYNVHAIHCEMINFPPKKGSCWHICDFEMKKKDFSFPDSQAALSFHLQLLPTTRPRCSWSIANSAMVPHMQMCTTKKKHFTPAVKGCFKWGVELFPCCATVLMNALKVWQSCLFCLVCMTGLFLFGNHFHTTRWNGSDGEKQTTPTKILAITASRKMQTDHRILANHSVAWGRLKLTVLSDSVRRGKIRRLCC